MNSSEEVKLSRWIEENNPANSNSLANRRTIFGVGVNDATYVVKPIIDGKEFLVLGNKTYSPETCIYLPSDINKFISGRDATIKKSKIGVYYEESSCKYKVMCCNPITKTRDFVGRFDDENGAYLAYVARKLEILELIKCRLDEIDTRLYQNLKAVVSTREY